MEEKKLQGKIDTAETFGAFQTRIETDWKFKKLNCPHLATSASSPLILALQTGL